MNTETKMPVAMLNYTMPMVSMKMLKTCFIFCLPGLCVGSQRKSIVFESKGAKYLLTNSFIKVLCLIKTPIVFKKLLYLC